MCRQATEKLRLCYRRSLRQSHKHSWKLIGSSLIFWKRGAEPRDTNFLGQPRTSSQRGARVTETLAFPLQCRLLPVCCAQGGAGEAVGRKQEVALTSPKAPRPITFSISKSSRWSRMSFTVLVNGLTEGDTTDRDNQSVSQSIRQCINQSSSSASSRPITANQGPIRHCLTHTLSYCEMIEGH